ncbi:MAG: O-antigen ligase family protein [Elusimicrobiota bacterium]|nr:O-antigen ligase family protein [Elusimicrobiota bacterium]
MNTEKILSYLFYFSLVVFIVSLPISYSGQAIGLTLGLIIWLANVIHKRKIFLQSKSRIGLFVLVFIFAMLISTVISGVTLVSLDGLRRILGCIALFFIVTQGIKDETQIKKLISILIIASSVAALYGIIQYFTGLNLLGLEKVKAFDRVQGTVCANSLGGIFGMVVPICLSVALFFKKKFYWICLSLIAICLGLTFTRGAWIGSVTAVVFILFIQNKKLPLLFMPIVIGVFLLWPQGRTRIIDTFKKGSESISVRQNMWQTAITMVKQKPIFGYGPQSFPEIFEESPLATEKGHIHCHNIYLGLASETGLLGLISFLTLVGYAFVLNFCLITKSSYDWMKYLSLGIAGSIVDFLVHGFVDYTLYGGTGYFFGFLLGIIAFEWSKIN